MSYAAFNKQADEAVIEALGLVATARHQAYDGRRFEHDDFYAQEAIVLALAALTSAVLAVERRLAAGQALA